MKLKYSVGPCLAISKLRRRKFFGTSNSRLWKFQTICSFRSEKTLDGSIPSEPHHFLKKSISKIPRRKNLAKKVPAVYYEKRVLITIQMASKLDDPINKFQAQVLFHYKFLCYSMTLPDLLLGQVFHRDQLSALWCIVNC